jgi:hypothetical protein
MKKRTLLLVAAFLFTLRLIAQEPPKIRFEKVSDEELNMKTYLNDSTTEAVILYDEGSSYVKWDAQYGFMLTYERFVRIKILKQSGVEWGNFDIILYSHDKIREIVGQIKGTTINLENGKIIKSELKKDAIFKEQQNKYWETARLAMPAVKVGSIIDLQYTVVSDLIWNLRPWKFQYTIPVKWSQYRVVIPEYYTFNQSSLGYHPLLYAKNTKKNETISFTGKKDYINLWSATGLGETQTISYMADMFDYAAKDVPAMKKEPYLSTLDNYTTQVKFEIAYADFMKVGGKYEKFNTSWNDVAKQLTDDESFGSQLKGDNFIDDVVSQLIKGITDNTEKLNIIYNYVQKTMKWNGSKAIFTKLNLKKAYSDKTGNSCDINLLLTVMLNKAGIAANPVILSTRENGLLPVAHASLSDCNYVIVRAIIEGKSILLDATEPSLQSGIIPLRCLNGEGHLINKEESESVQLTNPKSIGNTKVELQIKDGKITGMIQNWSTGLTAFNFRKSVKAAGGNKEYFDIIKNASSEIDYTEYQYNNLDSLNQPVIIEYKIAMKEGLDKGASVIYIDPVLINSHTDNPFTSPEREYPVDFGQSFSELYNLQLTIPEGYSVEELPKNTSLALPENGGKFQYLIAHVGNKITLNFRFSIDKTLFVPSEYQNLKEFYNLVIKKEAEQIILKKIAI